MEQPILDYGLTIRGQTHAQALASRLVRAGTPFSVEPYPNDMWRFAYKGEAHRIVTDEYRIVRALLD